MAHECPLWTSAGGAGGVCLVVLVALARQPPAAAQIGAAALTGIVVDASGAAVPAATVTVVAVSTNLPRTATTGPNGDYFVPGPPARRVSRARRRERLQAA